MDAKAKYLGVFLRNYLFLQKNWDRVRESVGGYLRDGCHPACHRTPGINNLVSSFLWPRLAVVDPSSTVHFSSLAAF